MNFLSSSAAADFCLSVVRDEGGLSTETIAVSRGNEATGHIGGPHKSGAAIGVVRNSNHTRRGVYINILVMSGVIFRLNLKCSARKVVYWVARRRTPRPGRAQRREEK